MARPRPVGLPDLSAELGLPRQTIHRILQQLADNGLLIRDPSRDRYAIGPRLSHLNLAALSSFTQRTASEAIPNAFTAQLARTCKAGHAGGLAFVELDGV